MKNDTMLIRVTDVILSLTGVILLLPIILIIFLSLFLETNTPIFTQTRVGKNWKYFKLYKFRSMLNSTHDQPTHLIGKESVTKIGKVLRYTKMDELPQLFNVIKGDMSLVGPRPCLPSQSQVIKEREKLNLKSWLPGITGYSQVNKIDMSDAKKISLGDFQLAKNFSFKSYFYYIFITLKGSGSGDNTHSS